MLFDKVKALCEERHISIYALEQACNIGNGTIRRWKNSSPNFETLTKVANYFKVPLEYFIEKNIERSGLID